MTRLLSLVDTDMWVIFGKPGFCLERGRHKNKGLSCTIAGEKPGSLIAAGP